MIRLIARYRKLSLWNKVGVWGGFASIVGIPLAIVFWLLSSSTLPETSGVLRPASAQMPPTPCGAIPSDAVTLLLGNSAVYTSQFPHTVLRVAGNDLLSVDKAMDGISVSARIFSPDGRIVAEIIKNVFHINPNNYFRLERPDKHTLIVYDQQAIQVLRVYYLNPSTIKFLGVFHFPGRRPLIIGEERQTIVGTFSGFCFGNNRIDFNIN